MLAMRETKQLQSRKGPEKCFLELCQDSQDKGLSSKEKVMAALVGVASFITTSVAIVFLFALRRRRAQRHRRRVGALRYQACSSDSAVGNSVDGADEARQLITQMSSDSTA